MLMLDDLRTAGGYLQTTGNVRGLWQQPTRHGETRTGVGRLAEVQHRPEQLDEAVQRTLKSDALYIARQH